MKQFFIDWLMIAAMLGGTVGACALIPWLMEKHPKIGGVYILMFTSLTLLLFAKSCSGEL